MSVVNKCAVLFPRQRQLYKNLPQSKYVAKSRGNVDRMEQEQENHSPDNSDSEEDDAAGGNSPDTKNSPVKPKQMEGNFEPESADVLDIGIEEDISFD